MWCSFVQSLKPGFAVSTMQVNHNFGGKAHRDQNNAGPSVIVALGNFRGGELELRPYFAQLPFRGLRSAAATRIKHAPIKQV